MKSIHVVILLLFTAPVFAQQKLFPIEIKGKWGYMDAQGTMKIKAQFDYADDFREGYAVVALNRRPCIIDQHAGRVIDTTQYMYIGPVSEGLSAVTDYSWNRYYINMKGEKVITLPREIYEARPFSNGMAVVSKQLELHETKFGRDIATLGYRFGFMDRNGKMIVDFIYDDADDLQGGISRVKTGTKFGLVNSEGREVLAPTYFNIGIFSEGKAVVDIEGKYGYINTKGEIVIKPQYDYAYPFSGGLAGVWMNKLYGFIDSTGTLKIQPVYEAVKPFGENKAAVKKDGKWGFIDRGGSWVIRNVFDDAGIFSEGLCGVLYKRKWGFIDETGAVAIPTDYDAVGSFHDGIADAMFNTVNFYISKKGQMLPVLK